MIPDYQQRLIDEAVRRARGGQPLPYTTRNQDIDRSMTNAGDGGLTDPDTHKSWWMVGVSPLDDTGYILR